MALADDPRDGMVLDATGAHQVPGLRAERTLSWRGSATPTGAVPCLDVRHAPHTWPGDHFRLALEVVSGAALKSRKPRNH
jgi:hypothetical protein